MEVNDDGERRLEMESVLSINWAELTRECLIDIFSRLSQEQRWIGPMLVCKTWMNACQDPSFNTTFDLETRFLSFPESINWWIPEFEDKVDSLLRSVVDQSQGGLTEIRVRHCTDHSLSYAAERCPNLEVLWIKSCPNVTDASMISIASNCPNLRVLDMSYSYGISHESLIMLGRNCQKLDILKRNLYPRLNPLRPVIVAPLDYLASYPKNANVEAEIIGRHMPQLKHLEFRYTTLTAKGLASVCEGCLDLEYMDLYGCISLTSDVITTSTSTLRNLREIKKPDFNFPMAILRMSRPGNPREG
ncbi:putative F-box/LRR-repeat protein 19 isoform X2 [Eutrema salsugineum]|uniref:putative F-box/LRR-repeat protein 19 isoform X2 n=1 Tax=Eutrema salsugineum TaxID=72664 RepID=UPI000CED5114|nr:putative F-box/LRR-repeat protein 19 isoform X2 [Eutrema salsugineum]